MRNRFSISDIQAREILSSRGRPTLEVDVLLSDQAFGRAAVPSGASTGAKEAHELRDGDSGRYRGQGVLGAVESVNGEIRQHLKDMNARQQAAVDSALLKLDGTENKSRLGANAVLGVSLATAYAAADSCGLSLYRYLGGTSARILPVPLMNILNGGQHAENNIQVQEFMIVPAGASRFSEALRWGAEVYSALQDELLKRGLSTGVGDEGGFAPDLGDDEEALQILCSAIKRAGFKPGEDVWLALDVAANDLINGEGYQLRDEKVGVDELIEMYQRWCSDYPIISLEDGLGEDDWDGWKKMTATLGGQVQLVGDDLFVTDAQLLQRGSCVGAANAILIKPNQIGSVMETQATLSCAQRIGYRACVSHRSGETEDTFIADLSVACGCGQIKTGAPCRTDRVAKYNQLLRIEQELGDAAEFAGVGAFMLK